MVKEFESIQALLNDNKFSIIFENEFNDLIKKRENRPKPKHGYFYKRDWYDRIRMLGELNFKFFINNIEDILNKKSKLSSEKREIIYYVFNNSITKFSETIEK